MQRSFNLHPVSKERKASISNDNVPPSFVGTVYIRNGPNAKYIQPTDHLFDGDGMAHCLEFQKENILYQNRWIQTHRFKVEHKHKQPIFVRLGHLTGSTIFESFLKKCLSYENPLDWKGDGTANTNVVYHAGKLLALNEMDFPYELEYSNNTLKTKGRYTFNNALCHNVNAHPKIEPDTSEMTLLGYSVFTKSCYISKVDKYGILYKTIYIPLDEPIIIHDFGITRSKYLVFHLPLKFHITNVLTSKFPIAYNKQLSSKLGIVDRTTSHTNWIPLPKNELIFHIACSWETSDRIVVYAFCYDVDDFDIQQLHLQQPFLKKFTVCKTTNKVTVKLKSKHRGELPVIEDSCVGTYTRYIYYSKISDSGFCGIIKHDTSTSKEHIVHFPEGKYGGECAIHGEYIVNTLYCPARDCSSFVIYNKNTLQLISEIPLPHRIPFGFHGRFFDIRRLLCQLKDVV